MVADRALGRRAAGRCATWTPAVDIQETGKDYRLTVEAPGLDPDDLRVDVTGNVLTIAGEKKVERNEGEGRFRLAERRAGRFERSFPLPEHVDADRITAEFENGVLTVVVPRQADAKPRRIEIKSSPPNRFTRPLTCRAADRADDASQRRARPNDEEELYQADLRPKYESAA